MLFSIVLATLKDGRADAIKRVRISDSKIHRLTPFPRFNLEPLTRRPAPFHQAPMILEKCKNCKHGTVKNGKSHCGKEALYSHLTSCIRLQALEEFLERNAIRERTA